MFRSLVDKLLSKATATSQRPTGFAPDIRQPAQTSQPAPGSRVVLSIQYDPHPDGAPDPGEVVWAWVPYEDDPSQGKDRPVLLISRHDHRLFGLMLTSQDRTRDSNREAAAGRHWMDLGSGPWDSKGRPSDIRLDRLIVLVDNDVRREGSVLDRQRFDQVIEAARPYLP